MPPSFGDLALRILLFCVLPAVTPAAPPESPAAPATPAVPVKLPRLADHADAQIQARVNEELTRIEAELRSAQVDCEAQLRDSGRAPDAGSFAVHASVPYRSARYFTVDITTSYFCGGAHPDSTHAPVTFDLRTGQSVDWPSMFKPGFLPSDPPGPEPGALTRVYREKSRQELASDPDCREVVMSLDPFVLGSSGGAAGDPPVFWLDAGRGVLVEPRFPHVSQACANAQALSPDEIAPHLKEPDLRDDLTATLARDR